jgi:genome maintenance exonuclease 1
MTFLHVMLKNSNDDLIELPLAKQVNINGKRHYETPSGTFVSITTLLSSKTPEGIDDWRKAVGDDVADYVMRTAASRGSKVHEIIEHFLSNIQLENLTQNYGVLPAGLFNLMKPSLQRINNIHAIETAVFSERLMVAGRVDCIAEFDGKLSTIDFKTASKLRDEINENYLLQATFYSLAWKELTGETVEQIVIITSTEDGQHYVHIDDPSKYVEKLENVIKEHQNSTS